MAAGRSAIARKRVYDGVKIVHVRGPSGAGKSTLGARIAKRFGRRGVRVVDTDDVDDPHSLRLTSESARSGDKKLWTAAFHRRLSAMNRSAVEAAAREGAGGVVVFVGFLHPGMDGIESAAEKRYHIKVDADTLFRQYNLRTLGKIAGNAGAIKRLLRGEKSLERVHSILSSKYGVRGGFTCRDPVEIAKSLRDGERDAVKGGYKVMDQGQIMEDLARWLE
jgi:hypothetical protein